MYFFGGDMRAHTHTRTHAHKYAQTHTNKHTHMHTHTHTHTHKVHSCKTAFSIVGSFPHDDFICVDFI